MVTKVDTFAFSATMMWGWKCEICDTLSILRKKMMEKDELNLGHGEGGLGQHLALPLHLLHKHHLPQGLLLERQLYHHHLHHQLKDDEQDH